MEASLAARSNNGIMDDEEEEEELRCMSSFSSEEEEEEDDNSRASLGSSSEELQEDATSSTSSLSLYPPSSSSSNDLLEEGPLFEMSSLVATLPFKRGLSKFFEGKSQSFTSLSTVSCLEDLAKPERPYKKKLKSSKSYAGGLDGPKPLSPTSSSRAITKKSSKGSFSSLKARRHNFVGNRPPIPPQRSSCPSSQILLFASRA